MAVVMLMTVVLSFLLSLCMAWMGLRALFHVIGNGAGSKLQSAQQQPAPRS
jgi:hypothetical protein